MLPTPPIRRRDLPCDGQHPGEKREERDALQNGQDWRSEAPCEEVTDIRDEIEASGGEQRRTQPAGGAGTPLRGEEADHGEGDRA